MVVSRNLSLLVTVKKLDMSQNHLDSQGHRFTHMKTQVSSLGMGMYHIHQMRRPFLFKVGVQGLCNDVCIESDCISLVATVYILNQSFLNFPTIQT